MSSMKSQASKDERNDKREIVKLRTEIVEIRSELLAQREVLIACQERNAPIPPEAVTAMIHGLSRRLSLGFMGTLD